MHPTSWAPLPRRMALARCLALLGGRRIFRFDGPLGSRNQIKGPYFKLGVYASGEITSPLVAYHDNYSRADSFEAVDPSTIHGAADEA